MEPSDNISVEESLVDLRNALTLIIGAAKQLSDDRPRSGAEITLALRKAQEARMWFGVAEAMEKGLDPWTNQVEAKE